MNSCELITLVSALALQISSSHTPKETALLASAFNQLGETLETILANEECHQERLQELPLSGFKNPPTEKAP